MAMIHIETNDLHNAGHCFGYILGGFVQGFKEGVNDYLNDLSQVLKEEAAARENEKTSETGPESEAQQ